MLEVGVSNFTVAPLAPSLAISWEERASGPVVE